MLKNTQIGEMKELNIQQANFYNNKKQNRNIATTIWWFIREKVLGKFRENVNINEDILKLHKNWFGDLSTKRVLDLGCYGGNLLSLYIAKESKEYVAIDLSSKGIDIFRQKLEKHSLIKNSIKTYAVDFLSDDFKEEPFDVIYIFSAMHHFKYFEDFLDRLKQFLKPGGIIVTYDPAETSWPVYVIRRLYRPFQSDSAWEWPFNKNSYRIIQQKFEVDSVQGVLGRSKWIFLLSWIPMKKEHFSKIARRMHEYDLKHATQFNTNLYSCLHVAMKLKNKAS